MKTVGMGQFRNRLGECVRVARSGERITVTSRGTPVIDLVPLATDELKRDEEFLQLMSTGNVRLPCPPDEVEGARPGMDASSGQPTPK